MSKKVFRLGFLPFLLLAPAVLWAQQGRVVAIKVIGPTRFPAEKIAAASGLKPGDMLGREEIQAAADRLAQLGPFRNVRYRFTTAADGLHVEFQLEDAPAVPVLFDNFPWFADEELAAALREAVVFFDGSAPEQGEILDRMTEALQKLIATRGVKATVERTLTAAPGEEVMVQRFQIIGASMKVEAVQFLDPLAAESKRLAEDVREVLNKPFSRFTLQIFAYEKMLPLYHERGFLRARVGTPEVRYTGHPAQPMPDKVTVVMPITPGPVFRLQGVAWSGNAAFSAEALNSIAALPRGELANGMHIFAAWQRVRSEYGRVGYIEVKVEPEPAFDLDAATVRYTVKIAEGLQYRLGRLVITGLSIPAERRLLAAWRLQQGDIFNLQYFEEFLEKDARQKRAFGDYVVHYTRVGHLLRPHPETRTVDVLIHFQ
jgi:outer membrane protein insertion porin family